MEIRKSGKLAIGIIAAAGTVGALHLMIFKDRASDYERAMSRFESVREQYNQQGAPPDLNEIYKFRYETTKYKEDFWQKVEKMRVALPPADLPDADGNIDTAAQRQRLSDLLSDLQKRREEGKNNNGPTLDFMDQVVDVPNLKIPGWNIAASLPQEIAEGKIATEDLMTNLVNQDKLLEGIDPNKPIYVNLDNAYQQSLARLGLNVAERSFLGDQYGGVMATLFTLNRIQLITDDLPENFFLDRGLTQAEAKDLMYKLFRIEWPKDFNDNVNYQPSYRQGQALIEIVETAKKDAVAKVLFVKMHKSMPIYWEEPKKPGEATPTPDMGMMGFGFDPMMGGDPAMMGGDPGMMGGGAGLYGAFGGGRGMATPTPRNDFIAFGAPVEVWVQGNNAAVMSFLYDMTHTASAIEMDRLELQNVPDQADQVIAKAYYNVVTYIMSLGLTSETDVAKKVVESQREIADMAINRAVIRELAVKDGILVKEGEQYKLTEASPTPWEGEEGDATPAPPAIDPNAAALIDPMAAMPGM